MDEIILHLLYLHLSRIPAWAWWQPSTRLTGSSLQTCELPVLHLALRHYDLPVSPVNIKSNHILRNRSYIYMRSTLMDPKDHGYVEGPSHYQARKTWSPLEVCYNHQRNEQNRRRPDRCQRLWDQYRRPYSLNSPWDTGFCTSTNSLHLFHAPGQSV